MSKYSEYTLAKVNAILADGKLKLTEKIAKIKAIKKNVGEEIDLRQPGARVGATYQELCDLYWQVDNLCPRRHIPGEGFRPCHIRRPRNANKARILRALTKAEEDGLPGRKADKSIKSLWMEGRIAGRRGRPDRHKNHGR